jgi:PAS domain-containing protein
MHDSRTAIDKGASSNELPGPNDNELYALRAAKSRLEAIANHLPAMIGYWNRDLRCEFANDAYLEWFGLSPQKVIGIHMIELMGDELFRLNEPHARMALSRPLQFGD